MGNRLRTAYRLFRDNGDWETAFECCRHLYNEFQDYQCLVNIRKHLTRRFEVTKDPMFLEFLKRSYILPAPDRFDDFMIAMEWNRPTKNKFYLPRRKILLPIVEDMQRLADGKLDVLGISAPPGIGKTGLGDFFLAFSVGRNPLIGNLMGSHSKAILADNYGECLRMLDSDEYLFSEIFPGHKVVRTNALDMKIDVDKPQKFSSLQFGSMGSGLAGRLRVNRGGVLYLDDLVPNIETAMNRVQLAKIVQQMYVDYLQRTEDPYKLLLIMTRWSIYDPMGELERRNEGNKKAKFIALSALDENDKSNFKFENGKGFSTKYYLNLRDTMDEASWKALYMNQPIEREGLLFPSDELEYFMDLPEDEAIIWAVCDTKDTGTDDCVMPVAYQIGEKYYIEEFICDDSTTEVLIPRLADCLVRHKVKKARFESNAAGGQIATQVSQKAKGMGGITDITKKYSTANKETRILVDSAWVKQHCVFKDKSKWTREYRKAMDLLCGYTIKGGRKQKDDVPDAMSMLANFVQSYESNVLTVGKRIF